MAQGEAVELPTEGQMALQLADMQRTMDTLWVLLAGILVFFMQAGFAYVEAGFTRAKNATNILTKNLMDFVAGTISYWAVGFAFMFGGGAASLFIGLDGFFLNKEQDPEALPIAVEYFFQLVFAATAATIVSGAMAERTKFKSYLFYSIFITGVIYPISGHWIWGGGWLAEKIGMHDFAGSTVVHSVGGWLALVGAWMLGPRIGKYDENGKPRAIPGHSLPMAALGTFILWLGWFGFNPGSTLAATVDIAHIAVTTNIAAAGGAVMAIVLAWGLYGKPDLALGLNGALAGLVGITAPCASVSPTSALLIGLICGAAMVGSVAFFDRIRIDDPVGAISVHGVCGAIGTLCVGLFAESRFGAGVGQDGLFFGGGAGLLGSQVIGVLAVLAWCLVTGFILFGAIKKIIGLRVDAQEEIEGLDITEHGAAAYNY
ncbi:MAG: ammonium transporter [Armatimonadia bacterium]|nr:ammonium transporter [Armatimonadia bacterium]